MRKKLDFFTCNEPCFDCNSLLMSRHDIFAVHSSMLGKHCLLIVAQETFLIINANIFFSLQNFPSCSLNLQSFQSLPKICSTWSVWCKENEAQEGDTTGNYSSTCDQSTSQSSINLVRVPPKLRRHHRKMPFRRRNWCGCIQVGPFAFI